MSPEYMIERITALENSHKELSKALEGVVEENRKQNIEIIRQLDKLCIHVLPDDKLGTKGVIRELSEKIEQTNSRMDEKIERTNQRLDDFLKRFEKVKFKALWVLVGILGGGTVLGKYLGKISEIFK